MAVTDVRPPPSLPQFGRGTAPSSTHVDVNGESGRATHFQSCVERMLIYWRDHDAIKNLDITVLDRERNRILKNIALGLDLQPLWPLVKKLVVAFAPYMERRGFWDAWHSVLTQAIRMAQRAKDIDAETTLTAFLARLCQRMSRPADVVQHYRRVIKLARQSGNRFEEARACSNLGYLYIDGGHWWRSEVLSQQALALFEELGSDHGRAHTHNHLGLLYLQQRKWDPAQIEFEASCQIWETGEDIHSLLYGYMNLGLLHVEKGNSQSALLNLNKAYQTALRAGETSNLPRIFSTIAVAHRQKLNWQEAERYAKEAERGFKEFRDEQGLANVWQTLGVIYFHSDQVPTAIHYLSEALAMQRKRKNKNGETQLCTTINKLAAMSRDDTAADKLRSLVMGY